MPLLSAEEDIPSKNCFRLVVLGSAKVGKTAVVARFLQNKFTENYTPTIEDFHRKVYRIKGEIYRLDILDTSGNDPFPAMRRLSLLTGDIFILVYAIDSNESFIEVKRYQQQIYESKGFNMKNKRKIQVPLVIVGNKSDREKNREVEMNELVSLCEGYSTCGYIETSAKKNINIDELFVKLFMLAKLPAEMSPSLHRKVQSTSMCNQGNTSPNSSMRRVTFRRNLSSDACGAISPNPRRPSIRTDLLMWQTRSHFTQDDSDINRDSKNCLIQ